MITSHCTPPNTRFACHTCHQLPLIAQSSENFGFETDLSSYTLQNRRRQDKTPGVTTTSATKRASRETAIWPICSLPTRYFAFLLICLQSACAIWVFTHACVIIIRPVSMVTPTVLAAPPRALTWQSIYVCCLTNHCCLGERFNAPLCCSCDF